jgi:hypothetical protein
MRSCLAKKFLPVIAVFGAACGGGAGPFSDDPVGPLPGVLCAKGPVAGWRDAVSYYQPTGTASWAAIQRENQPWQTIDATEATVPLNPGERIGMARWIPALSPHSGDLVEIFFVTAEQAQTAFPCVSSSTKSVHGTAQGLEDGSLPGNLGGYISIGNIATYLANGPFTLDGVSLGHTDLVATRLDAPPKTIIRRGVDYPNGAGISLLDFGSIEAAWLEPHTITVNGANIIHFTASSQIVTQRGTVGLLSEDFAREGSNIQTLTLYSAPEGRLTNDEVQFFSVDPADYRKAMVFFRHPADRTVTLAPDPTIATATHLGTAPNLTLRLDMPSQPEYGAQVTFTLCSPGGASYYSPGTAVGLLVTKEYFGGTPPTWSVTVPDLTSVQGFPPSVQGFPDPDIRAYNLCHVDGLTNIPFVFAPRTTHDGDVFTSLAYESNVVNK